MSFLLATVLVRSIPLAKSTQSGPLSGGLMLFVVLLGLALAIAFQMLLASLGLAMGLSFARPLFSSGNTENSPAVCPEQTAQSTQTDGDRAGLLSQGQILSAVGIVAGLSLLLTVDSVLFGASFLAVRFSQLAQPLSGITLGLVIWAVYLLLLLTLGSNVLGSTAELLLGGAATSLRRMLDLVKQVLSDPPSQTPSLEQEQMIVSVQQQLKGLQGEIAILAQQATQIDPVAESLAKTPPITVSKQPRKNENGDRNIAVATVSKPGKSLGLKAAAISQTAALASTAQTTVSESWQQVKDQVRQQVDDGASALLTSLNEEIQSQAQQALEQVDLSDWSLERLWDWARALHPGGSDRPYPAPAQEGSDANQQFETSDRDAIAASREPKSPAKPAPEVCQVNRDLKNYLKYTSLTKLDQVALGQKLDECLNPWLEASPAGVERMALPKRGTVEPQMFDLEAWRQALQSRKGIQPARLEQYMAIIEAKLDILFASLRKDSDPSDGILVTVKAKLSPLLAQLNLNELSLEDFKQLVMVLAQGGDLASGLSERLGLDELDLSSLTLSELVPSQQETSVETSNSPGSSPDSHLAREPETKPLGIPEQHPASAPPSDGVAESKRSDENHPMERLPSIHSDALQGLANQAQALFAQLDDSLQQSIEASSDLLPKAGQPLQQLRDRLPSLCDHLVSQLRELPEQTGDQIHQWVEATQIQLGEQMEQAQSGLESSFHTLQQQAMEQAEQVRHWAAVAAWWLFGLTLSSAIAAGAAGYWAVTSPLLRTFSLD